MKERGILFNGPMVRAILAGTKTQTRRVVKPVPDWENPQPCCAETSEGFQGPINRSMWSSGGTWTEDEDPRRCPYGQPGDQLWVREAWAHTVVLGNPVTVYRAEDNRTDYGGPWKPSIHMPRWASRITLEITGVRVERLQDISEQDARAEGCSEDDKIRNALVDPVTGKVSVEWEERAGSAREAFCNLWQHINRRRYDEPTSWEENPYVWVVEFRRDAK